MIFKIMPLIVLAWLMPLVSQAEFHDPTQPAYPLPPPSVDAESRDHESAPELVLSAIWISAKSRRAMINGKIARPGETITLTQTAALNLEPVAMDNKEGTFNKAMKSALSLSGANSGMALPSKEMAGPLGYMVGPLVAAAMKSMDVPQLQPSMNADTGTGHAVKMAPRLLPMPERSTTIKIISIHKNSVTIDQNGEVKTLELVQRPYKTSIQPL